jgi:hypothetical protein
VRLLKPDFALVAAAAAAPVLLQARAGPITAATLPGIKCLTALNELALYSCELEPSCLLPMATGLTRFCLWGVALQPEEAEQESALGASQLLQLLARQTALRELTLDRIAGDWPQQLAAYSALTASSNLRQLRIQSCELQGAAWLHVFPAGCKLPQLHVFSAQGSGLFGSPDIGRLVSCCPAMEGLDFTPAADASLAPLQSLTALTRLDVGSVSPRIARSGLAALSQLQSLRFGFPQPAALQHLVPLSALTCLTYLHVWAPSVHLNNKVSDALLSLGCVQAVLHVHAAWMMCWCVAGCCPLHPLPHTTCHMLSRSTTGCVVQRHTSSLAQSALLPSAATWQH